MATQKKRTDMIAVLENLLKGEKVYDAKTLFLKLKKANAALLDLSKKR